MLVGGPSGGGADTQNVATTGDTVGLTLLGATNQTNTLVEFESPSQFLAAVTSGAGQIEAREEEEFNSAQVAINDPIVISLQNAGLTFGELSFNLFNGGPLGDGGTVTIFVSGFEANGDPVSTVFTTDSEGDPLEIGNGANFYTVTAFDGQRITSVEISPVDDTNYAELRQIRISNIVPEPSSLLLVCVGALSFNSRRRRS
jgi:hypothetical protein